VKCAECGVMMVAQASEALEDYGLAVEVARDATDEDTAELNEAESAIVETGRRAPVVIDFQVMKPGPGNKRDNRYYPADVVERDIHVFDEADVFATDHKETERSERTKVGKVLQVPVRFTEHRAPVARVLIYDPRQAEKARNRADAGALDTLECSIFGSGRVKKGKVGDQEYSIVEAITQGKYLELVSKAGAGGHALNLAESGGDVMEQVEDVAQETPVEQVVTEVEEVALAEGDETPSEQIEEQASEQVSLGEAEVAQLVEGARLPQGVKDLLILAEYADEDELKARITGMTEAFTKATGSGTPAVTGGNALPVAKKKRTLAEIDATIDEVNEQWLGKPLQEVKQ